MREGAKEGLKAGGLIAVTALGLSQPELLPFIEFGMIFGKMFAKNKRRHEAEKQEQQKAIKQNELDQQIEQQRLIDQQKEQERVDELNQRKSQQDQMFNDIYQQRMEENHQKTQDDLNNLEFSRQMRILELQRNHKIDIVDVWNGHHEYNQDAGIDPYDHDWEDVETKTINQDDEDYKNGYWFDEDENEDHMIPEQVDEQQESKPRSSNPYESMILSLSDQIQAQKNRSDQIQKEYDYQKELNKVDDPLKDVQQQQIAEIQANQNLTQNLVLTALEGLNSQELTLEEIDAQLSILTQLIEENIPRALKLDPSFIFSQNMVSFQQQ